MTAEDIMSLRTDYKAYLDTALTQVPSYHPESNMLQKQWQSMVWPFSTQAVHSPDTGVSSETLETLAKASVDVPTGFVYLQFDLILD